MYRKILHSLIVVGIFGCVLMHNPTAISVNQIENELTAQETPEPIIYLDSGISPFVLLRQTRINCELSKILTANLNHAIDEGCGRAIDQLSTEFTERFRESLVFDFTGAFPQNLNVNRYDHFGEHYESFSSLNSIIGTSVEAAFSLAAKSISDEHNLSKEMFILQDDTELSWQTFAALYKVYHEDMADLLFDSLTVQTSETQNAEITLTVSFPDFDYIADETSQEDWFSARFAYYYLNTYYNPDGSVRDTEYQKLPTNYVVSICLPVEERFEAGIKRGWYRGRSGGTRRHMGTDIRGSAKSELYSCTDGIVTCSGYDSIAGYYVCVLDDFGYEYHFYHLFELSTFVAKGDRVKAGQVIGLMGNTGNSVANHLHLAIISPEKYHIDPYEVLTQAGYGNEGLPVLLPKPVFADDEV